MGGGGGHPDPEVRGRPGLNFFSTLRASVWSKNKGGGSPGPSPGSATGGIKATLASPHPLPPGKTWSCNVRIVFLQTNSALSKKRARLTVIDMTWALKLTSLPLQAESM